MRLHYVSPSVLPSRTANAVHVALQCDALARAGAELTLYCRRTVADERALPAALAKAYGVNADAWRVVSYHGGLGRGDTLRIAALAVADIRRHRPAPDAVLSRNLYASFALAVLQRRRLIFEAHDLEYGVRQRMQRAIITRPGVTTVAISQALIHHLTKHHGVAPARTAVLHDAAPGGMQPIAPELRRARLASLVPAASGSWLATCAYFGHLYPGRGVEIIEAMAEARPAVLFLVFGGNESEIGARRAANRRANLHFVGHVPHTVAREAMAAAETLLLPYQTSVSIGIARHDTAAWMSPMKMFEYLASGVPIISSDLPVLREVLEDGRNALLVPAADPAAWITALDRLTGDPRLARDLGRTGHADYLEHHTWDQRARALMALAEPF